MWVGEIASSSGCGWRLQFYGGGHLATSAPTHYSLKPPLMTGCSLLKSATLSTNYPRTGGGRRRKRTMSLNAAPPAAAESLRKGIAEFYDESSGVWEDIWGDHMHHGFYEPDADVSISDHRAAQIRMIEESLAFASLSGSSLAALLCR